MASEREKEVAEGLPEDEREVFYDLVADYRQHALEQTGQAFVSFDIIRDLVKDGWRKLGVHLEEE